VLAAGVAELGELQPASGRLLVLGGGVVPVLASRTLQGDDLAHWLVLLYIYIELASHLGWQAACRLDWTPKSSSRLTRRDTGLIGPCCQILNCASGGQSGQATLNQRNYLLKIGSGKAANDETQSQASPPAKKKRRLSTDAATIK